MSVPGRKAGRSVKSEEELIIFCEPCSDEGQQLTASGFCVDCCEYLCNTCFTHHRRARPFRHHVLQDQKTMPRSKPLTKTVDTTVDKCPQHQGEVITFNCKSHDQLVCGTCIAIDHRSCDGISYVEKEYDELEKELADLGQKIDSDKITTKQNVTDTDKYSSEAIESIGQFRAEITHFLDKLEQDVINEANRRREEDQENMISISYKLDDMRSEIQSTTTNLDHLHKTKQNGKLFPAMDKTKLEMQKLEDHLTQIKTDNKIQMYRFEPEKQIQELMENLTTLGSLSLMNEPNDTKITQMKEQKQSKTTQTSEIFSEGKATQTEIPNYNQATQTEIPNYNQVTQTEIPNYSQETQTEIPNYSKASQTEIYNDCKVTQTENNIDRKTTETEKPVPRTATHQTDIYVEYVATEDGESDCWITGSALLPDDQLVITDCSNSNVKLLDTKQNSIMDEIQLKFERGCTTFDTRGITKVSDTHVAVTHGSNIQLLSVVSHTLSKGQEIWVNGDCFGIKYNDGTLIVTFSNPAKVEIINMTGIVLRSLMNDTINKQLFDSPRYIAISPDKTALYVSDDTKHTVTCMAMDGTVKAVYKDNNLHRPAGLAIDRTGTVYVCGEGSYNIHQITAECTKIQILLAPDHGVLGPCSITYCDREDKLYIGMYKQNVVKVFQLK